MLDAIYLKGKRMTRKHVPIRLKRGPGNELETRYLDFIYGPVRDASDAVVGVFCECSERTDAKLTAEKLNDVQAQLIQGPRIGV